MFEMHIEPWVGSKEQKILIVANSMLGGGAEEASFNLFLTFQSLPHFQTYFCAINNSDSRALNLTLENRIFQLNRTHRTGISATIRSLFEFYRIINQIKPSFTIVNCELPELFVSLCRNPGKNVICIEHTTFPWAGRRILGLFVRSILVIRGVKWVTVNSAQERVWITGKKAQHIPNIVFPPKYQEDTSPILSELVFIGRLTESKRPEMVIEAGIASGIRVNLFGNGILMGELVHKYGYLEDSVCFHGFVPNLYELITPGSLIVVPSDYEGDGLVVVEAILAGIPILLKDNVDLRRFQLPDLHYFDSQGDLDSKIQYIQENGLSRFVLPNDVRESLLKTRSSRSILESWVDYLGISAKIKSKKNIKPGGFYG
jgi:glycosyltransferase involved in cell wall biosynthesis